MASVVRSNANVEDANGSIETVRLDLRIKKTVRLRLLVSLTLRQHLALIRKE